MPNATFTPAQDKALLAAILTIPAQRVAAAILFLMIRSMHDRVQLVQYLASL